MLAITSLVWSRVYLLMPDQLKSHDWFWPIAHMDFLQWTKRAYESRIKMLFAYLISVPYKVLTSNSAAGIHLGIKHFLILVLFSILFGKYLNSVSLKTLKFYLLNNLYKFKGKLQNIWRRVHKVLHFTMYIMFYHVHTEGIQFTIYNPLQLAIHDLATCTDSFQLNTV